MRYAGINRICAWLIVVGVLLTACQLQPAPSLDRELDAAYRVALTVATVTTFIRLGFEVPNASDFAATPVTYTFGTPTTVVMVTCQATCTVTGIDPGWVPGPYNPAFFDLLLPTTLRSRAQIHAVAYATLGQHLGPATRRLWYQLECLPIAQRRFGTAAPWLVSPDDAHTTVVIDGYTGQVLARR